MKPNNPVESLASAVYSAINGDLPIISYNKKTIKDSKAVETSKEIVCYNCEKPIHYKNN